MQGIIVQLQVEWGCWYQRQSCISRPWSVKYYQSASKYWAKLDAPDVINAVRECSFWHLPLETFDKVQCSTIDPPHSTSIDTSIVFHNVGKLARLIRVVRFGSDTLSSRDRPVSLADSERSAMDQCRTKVNMQLHSYIRIFLSKHPNHPGQKIGASCLRSTYNQSTALEILEVFNCTTSVELPGSFQRSAALTALSFV